MAVGYRILDEPRPGALAKVAVKPLWPLFVVMFFGPVVSWPWFVLNGFAMGSPTRFRELTIAVTGFLGLFVLLVALGFLRKNGVIGPVAVTYSSIVYVGWQLLISYWLYVLQSRTYALFEHFRVR